MNPKTDMNQSQVEQQTPSKVEMVAAVRTLSSLEMTADQRRALYARLGVEDSLSAEALEYLVETGEPLPSACAHIRQARAAGLPVSVYLYEHAFLFDFELVEIIHRLAVIEHPDPDEITLVLMRDGSLRKVERSGTPVWEMHDRGAVIEATYFPEGEYTAAFRSGRTTDG